jgi:hypothetical protein
VFRSEIIHFIEMVGVAQNVQASQHFVAVDGARIAVDFEHIVLLLSEETNGSRKRELWQS